MFIATGSNVFIKPTEKNDAKTQIGTVMSVGLNGDSHFDDGDTVVYNTDDVTEVTIGRDIVHCVVYHKVCGKQGKQKNIDFAGFEVF